MRNCRGKYQAQKHTALMKAAVLYTIFFAWVSFGRCGTLFSAAVQQSQRAAVQVYPELGIEHSPLNQLFWETYSNYQFNKPAYFENDQWPIQLANDCVQELARVEKGKAAIKIRTQVFKDFPVPKPTTTPFDSDPQKRKEYLSAYQSSYRDTLITQRRIVLIICGKGPLPPSIEGSNAGVSAACHDHPKSISKPDALP